MLLDLLSQYLGDIAIEVRELENAKVEHYEEELLATNRVNLRIRVRFLNGYLLELNEAAIVEAGQLIHLGYRYHFQDKQNKLVFRYDNTPHFPDLEGFPHHKHLSDKVTGTEKPSILEVINEARLLAK
ncbi:hypothetical protein BuS5_03756 [Desulfosarcina sp. BuS5]|uniref:toxin TumE n=1 Tax=Desulfosarcina sp. BuS5 TaxID=933262 RepID=UPI002378E8A6|nr:DUF6516 family protein [Desulfosarcina sp. BuS5]WDN90785.1 hypothetical protein BuS5_03756 [Desulfosarcina sp. BuS5]